MFFFPLPSVGEGCAALANPKGELRRSWVRGTLDEDPPFGFREDLAEQIRPVLAGLIQTMLAWAEMEQQG